MRDQLQAWHHGHGTIPPFQGVMAGLFPTLSIHTAVAIMALEALAGMTIAMIGWVHRFSLKEARLCDYTRNDRYDVYMNTGVPFVHFNHRGTLAGRSGQGAVTAGDKKGN